MKGNLHLCSSKRDAKNVGESQMSGAESASNEQTVVVREVDRQLATGLLVFFAVGLLGCLLSTWWISAIAVCGYFVFGYMLKRNARQTEKFADNLYYIGFLLTLWGLFFAFSPWETGPIASSTEEIVEQFGIALITTVLGISFRLYVQQLAQTVFDQEEDASDLVERSILDLQRELAAVTAALRVQRLELSGLGTVAVAEAEQGIRGLREVREAVLKDMAAKVGRDVEAFAKALESRVDLLRWERIVPVGPITEASGELVRSIRGLSTAVEEVHVAGQNSLQLLSRSAASMAAQFAVVTSGVDTLGKETGKAGASAALAASAAGQLATQIQASAAAVSRIAEAEQSLALGTLKYKEFLSSNLQSAEQLSQITASISSSIRRLDTSVAESVSALRMEIERDSK